MAEQKLKWNETPTGYRAEWEGWIFELEGYPDNDQPICYQALVNGVCVGSHSPLTHAKFIMSRFARAIAAKEVIKPDSVELILDMSEDEIDQCLRLDGYDPEEVGRNGLEMLKSILDKHKDLTGVWMPCHESMPKVGELIEVGYLGKDGEIVATSKFMVKETWPEVVFFEGGGFLATRGFWRSAQ